MSSAVLQWIAVVTMVIDHIGFAFFPQHIFLRAIGRVSYPIFAFLLAQGFSLTSNRRKYALRLAVFALLSEIPFQLFSYGRLVPEAPVKNILFTMLIAFGAMWLVKKGGWYLLGAAVLAAGAEVLGCSYGAYGVMLTVCFYLCSRERMQSGELCPGSRERVLVALALLCCTLADCIISGSYFQMTAVFAAFPLALYTGEQGKRMPRYFLYIFYPLHILALYFSFLLM